MDATETKSWSAAFLSLWMRHFSGLASFLRAFSVRPREKSLRLCETLSLGDKRFLAIVQLEGRRFLIGATPQSIALLDRLESQPERRRGASSEPQLSHGVH